MRITQITTLLVIVSLLTSGTVQAQTDFRKSMKSESSTGASSPKRNSIIGNHTSDTLNNVALYNGKLYNAYLDRGDTVPMVSLPLVSVKKNRVFKNKRQRRRYNRLERHVRKVYPFAKLANEKLVAYEKTLKGMTEQRRKKFMRAAEKEIRNDFSDDLKALTWTQGRILLRLIDRETGAVSYELVKDLRGGFTAWIFQGVAKMFDFDLKAEYNPEKDDKLIEEIVQQIEQEELFEQTVSR